MTESHSFDNRSPAEAARVHKFKLKLSLPGRDIGGEWLCRMTGQAMAYRNYCGTGGTPRVFSWYHHSDGKAYLQDQEGNWLSYASADDCLYMSYWNNAVAWRIEGGRLIRDGDGAVLSMKKHQRWPLADGHFLQALSSSSEALDVAVVEEEPTAVERLISVLTPVYVKRHAPLDGVDRYLYTARPSRAPGAGPERERYEGDQVAFFAVTGTAEGEATVPVYLLSMVVPDEQRTYYKLSLRTDEDGYTLENPGDPAPNFYAFDGAVDRPYLAPVYQHAAENPTAGQCRYVYDFRPEAHDGWSEGVAVFRGITMEEAEQALIGSLGAESARSYAAEWARVYGDKLAELLKGLGKSDMNHTVVKKMRELFEGMPETKYMSLGAGLHGGYGVGAVGFELGSIWRAADFGHVPMHEPLSDYSVEWVTFGASGIDLGASADALSIGTWFGDISQIDGACNGVTITLQAGGGISITLLWDGSWRGANYGPHPIGVTVIASIGVEIGVGLFYNASATQFWNRRPDFPKM